MSYSEGYKNMRNEDEAPPGHIKVWNEAAGRWTNQPFPSGDKTAGTSAPFVAQQLNAAAAIFAERDKQYGAAYKRFGAILHALFPEGVRADGPEDMGRLALVLMQVAKLNRYTANFSRGGHDDSLDDLAVYSMMLKELDREAVVTEVASSPPAFPQPEYQEWKTASEAWQKDFSYKTGAEEEFLGGHEEREDHDAACRALNGATATYRAKTEEMERARDQYAREADGIAAERAHHKAALAAARKASFIQGHQVGAIDERYKRRRADHPEQAWQETQSKEDGA